jgi:hypothetical protein
MKRMESAEKKSRSSGSSIKTPSISKSGKEGLQSLQLPELQRLQRPGIPLPSYPATTEYVVCARNDGYPASLEIRKIYSVVCDPNLPPGTIRVIDESGEDYLYPAGWFEPIKLTARLREALRLAS